MLEFLTAYSIEQIIVFIVMLLFAIKGGIELLEWFKGRYNKRFNKDYKKKNKELDLEKHYINYEEYKKEEIERYNALESKIDNLSNVFDSRFIKIENDINTLLESDRDDIKSWLVEKYNFYKENPNRPISHHTMDTIERRYNHYKQEGGNSYIEQYIMPGLRQMAKEEQRVKL